MTFDVDGQIVVLSTLSTPEQREFLEPWLDLDWTTDWESVQWVDETYEASSGGP